MIKILRAPEYEIITNPLIFLAGPIQGAPDWQAEAISILSQSNAEFSIASPRRLAEKKGNFSVDKYNEQVDWETHHLRLAGKTGVIMFWMAKEAYDVPGRAYAQTSRFELGEWKTRHELLKIKLVLGIELGFTNEKYLRRRLKQDCHDIEIQSTLAETCAEALRLLSL